MERITVIILVLSIDLFYDLQSSFDVINFQCPSPLLHPSVFYTVVLHHYILELPCIKDVAPDEQAVTFSTVIPLTQV